MEQASRLDLATYENPVFYDRLERARVQATDRLAMIQQMGRLIPAGDHDAQLYAVPRLVLAVAGAAACRWACCRRSSARRHFAFLGYAKNFRQTPASGRWTICARSAAAGKAAKELKLFGLQRLPHRHVSRRFADQIYDQNVLRSRAAS